MRPQQRCTGRDHEQSGDRITGDPQCEPAPSCRGTMSDERGFTEYDVLQEAFEKVAPPLHRPQALRAALVHAERSRQSTGEAIEWRSLLGTRGEVHAPQLWCR